ncbi:hypothetical protein COLO4_02521, partial [Corchorus olitorius]
MNSLPGGAPGHRGGHPRPGHRPAAQHPGLVRDPAAGAGGADRGDHVLRALLLPRAAPGIPGEEGPGLRGAQASPAGPAGGPRRPLSRRAQCR